MEEILTICASITIAKAKEYGITDECHLQFMFAASCVYAFYSIALVLNRGGAR
jgi:hypothetical protein